MSYLPFTTLRIYKYRKKLTSSKCDAVYQEPVIFVGDPSLITIIYFMDDKRVISYFTSILRFINALFVFCIDQYDII